METRCLPLPLLLLLAALPATLQSGTHGGTIVGWPLRNLFFINHHKRLNNNLPSPISRCTHPTGMMHERQQQHQMTGGGGQSSTQDFEVEEKFSTADCLEHVEERLGSLGFVASGTVKFKDTYVDLPAPQWCLTPRDWWLRYREDETQGVWQLKRRPPRSKAASGANNGDNHHQQGGATVYEEIEGREAIDAAMELVRQMSSYVPKEEEDGRNDTDEGGDGGTCPPGIEDTGLVPFAAFETSRSSWTCRTSRLRVDLDSTCFGYHVGEVEAVVSSESQVDEARKEIAVLIEKIAKKKKKTTTSGDSNRSIPFGKVELYIKREWPDLHGLCVKNGSIKAR